MLSTLITVAAIALAIGLTLASLYYGGTAYTRYAAGSEFAKLTAQVNQIQGAVEVYKSDHGVAPKNVAQLVDGKYLKDAPDGNWLFSDTYLVRTSGVADDHCLEYNRKQGLPIVPLCSDPEYLNKSVCCKG